MSNLVSASFRPIALQCHPARCYQTTAKFLKPKIIQNEISKFKKQRHHTTHPAIGMRLLIILVPKTSAADAVISGSFVTDNAEVVDPGDGEGRRFCETCIRSDDGHA